jgi:glucans biosynthesis protein C
MKNNRRYYDLDWLRVIVFGILILYHVGMFFVPWGWHLKNNTLYPWLQWPMMFVNQWRLPMLFVISGIGTWFALGYRNLPGFVGERTRRLLLPLVFGILVIIPPQIYFERVAYGQWEGSYISFLLGPAFQGTYPEGNFSWHHLWFLVYLLVFSYILAPLFVYLRRRPDNRLLRLTRKLVSHPAGVLLPILPLTLAEAWLRPLFPVTHALYNDWFTLSRYGLLFLVGFLLGGAAASFRSMVVTYRRGFLVSGMSLSLLYLACIGFSCAMPGIFWPVLRAAGSWIMIMAISGYAATYLNRDSKVLRYCNQAVYPFYTLHQTITVAIAFFIMDKDWTFFPKAVILTAGTFGISWLLYEFFIRRVKLVGQLFGIKKIVVPCAKFSTVDT